MSAAGSRSVRHCTICGAPSATSSVFCGNCGRVLDVPRSATAANYCRDCGGETSLGDAYCPNCGAPQPPNTRPAATAPRAAPSMRPPEPAPSGYAPIPAPPASLAEPPREAAGPAEPGLGVSVLWFFFVGLWLSLLVTVFAWMAAATVVGMPAGVWLAKRVPHLLTLHWAPKPRRGAGSHRATGMARERVPQIATSTRAVYFALVGWWLGLAWLILAWELAIFILPIPLSRWMLERLATVMTLEQE